VGTRPYEKREPVMVLFLSAQSLQIIEPLLMTYIKVLEFVEWYKEWY